MQREFNFVERPSQELFCPVSFELLLEPQLTSCCGHHLSLEVTIRLKDEGRACPLCNGEQWQCMLDKNCRRKVHQLRVHCWHMDNGCGWVGEIYGLKVHADSCDKRPWECKYCGLKCMYGEGEGRHWPTCPKFPKPCPNICGVGNVERCNMEQHRRVCPMEPVACEMKEFGCSVVVPRKELATHMRVSELQHLTSMTMLNLRLTKQLQWESLEKDKKIIQLQQDLSDQAEIKAEMEERMRKIEREVESQKQHNNTAALNPSHCIASSGCLVFTVTEYSKRKDGSGGSMFSDPFYSHHHGYKFRMKIKIIEGGNYYGYYTNIKSFIYLVKGEYDDELPWPVEGNCVIELLNQARDNKHDILYNFNFSFKKDYGNDIQYQRQTNCSELEEGPHDMSVRYLLDDCLKLRVKVNV